MRHKEHQRHSNIERGRRKSDTCFVRRVWNRWGVHIEIAGWFPIMGGVITILWSGFHFISDTQASWGVVKVDHIKIQVARLRQDRMDDNLQLIMQHMNVPPLKKSESEKELERLEADLEKDVE